MPILARAKNILLTPQAEWGVISHETATPQSLLGKYVVPMSLLPALASFVGFGLIGISEGPIRMNDPKWGLIMAIISFLVSVLGYLVSAYITDALGPSLGAGKNSGGSAQLVAYSLTAYWVAGILLLLPSLSVISMILSLYGVYLMYLGAGTVMKVAQDKRVLYTLVIFVVLILVAYVIDLVVTRIVFAILGSPFGMAGDLHDMYWR